MATYNQINSNTAFAYGEENSVASFHYWLINLFDHANGYPVFFDKDNDEFIRTVTTFPSINVQQIDTIDVNNNFLGGRVNKAKLLFYVYFNHHLQQGGSRRLLRRGRDQLSFAFKMAGIKPTDSDEFVIDPIYMYDFSTNPPTRMATGALTIDPGIQQRFIQNGEVLQYEFMLSLSYIEHLTT